jgi:lipopolysaccharide/colanic/teichoic acid biosynthesis glycosyltransferase
MSRKIWLLLFADLALMAAATLSAFLIRDNFDLSAEKWPDVLSYIGISVACGAIVFTAAGAHRSVWRFSNLNDYLWLSSLTVVLVLAAVAVGFLVNRLDGVARALPILQVILVVAAMVVARVAYRLFHARRHATRAIADHDDDVDTVLVVGVNPVSDLYLRSVEDLAKGRIRIGGVIAENEDHLLGRKVGTYPVLGQLRNLEDVLRQLKVHGIEIDRIVVTVDEDGLDETGRSLLARQEADHGVSIDFFADRLGLKPMRQPAVQSEAPTIAGPAGARALSPAPGPYRFLKRLVDLSGATFLLILLWPLVMIVAALVWLDVGRPLLFWQQRPGLGGRPIRVFKFRTMGRAHDEAGNRLSDAHRLSAIGRVLRDKRLDELPQLFNILVGDMSFVGPRPLLPVDQPGDRRDRLRAKPGLTGWAQVMGGRDISAGDKAALDRWYVDNVSFLLDVEIVLRTIPMVLFGERIDAQAIRAACDAMGRRPDLAEAREIDMTPQVTDAAIEEAASRRSAGN